MPFSRKHNKKIPATVRPPGFLPLSGSWEVPLFLPGHCGHTFILGDGAPDEEQQHGTDY